MVSFIPHAPVEQHRTVQHKGFNSKAKQNSQGNGAVGCFSVAREGNERSGEIKHISSSSQNNPALRPYFNVPENELLQFRVVGAGSNFAWAQPVSASCPHTGNSQP